MALIGAHAPGATPLTEEDIRGLKLASITTQGELNEAEAQNIIRGQEWALRSHVRHRMPSGRLSDSNVPRPSVLQRADLAEIVELVLDDDPLEELDALIAELRFDPHS
jgi:hypothetical protein